MISRTDDGGDIDSFMKEVKILKAISLFKRAIFLVTPETTTNCFKKAGFVQSLENHKFRNHLLFEVESAIQQVDNVDCSLFNEIFELDANTELYEDLTDAKTLAQMCKNMTRKMNSLMKFILKFQN